MPRLRAPGNRYRAARAGHEPEAELGETDAGVVGSHDATRERRKLDPRAEARAVQADDQAPFELMEPPRQ